MVVQEWGGRCTWGAADGRFSRGHTTETEGAQHQVPGLIRAYPGSHWTLSRGRWIGRQFEGKREGFSQARIKLSVVTDRCPGGGRSLSQRYPLDSLTSPCMDRRDGLMLATRDGQW